MKNKRGILLLGLAVLCGFGTIRAAHSYLAQQQPEATLVAVAAKGLDAGDVLAIEDFRFAELPRQSAPTGALNRTEQLEGRLLRRALVVSEPILESALYAAGTDAKDSGFGAPDGPPRHERLYPSGSRIVRISAAHAAEDVLRRIEVERGKSVVLLPDFPVSRVVVGDPELLEANSQNPQTIELRALAVGDTNVLLWDPRGHLQTALDVHIGAFRSQIVAEIREVLGNDRIEVAMAGEAIVLKGTADNVEERERAEQVAQAFFAGSRGADTRLVNLIDVGGNHQVMIEVTLAEMSRKHSREYGVDFNALITGAHSVFQASSPLGLANQAASSVSGSVTRGDLDLDASIDLLKERGLVKVLAEPILVARSGHKASFLAGGEVPIPIPSGDIGGVAIEYKPFGVGVEFVPTVRGRDLIHLEVTPEVSQPDFALGTTFRGTRVPAFNTRRASTAVELHDGQAFAIAGLLSDKVSSVVAENPGMADVPILGNLFRSQEFQQEQTELVLIVKPRLVKPLDPGPTPLPSDHYVPPTDKEFFLFGRHEGAPQNATASSEGGGMMGQRGHLLPVQDGDQG
jgi:pilus assembly protein CpaC